MFQTRSFFFGTTTGVDLINIGHDVRGFLRESRAENGMVTVGFRHPGASVALLAADGKKGAEEIQQALKGSFPAPLRSLLPQSLTLPVEGGKVVCDPWQEIFLVDYEAVGRRREVVVQIFTETPEPAKGRR